jgi:DNA repair protein RadC
MEFYTKIGSRYRVATPDQILDSARAISAARYVEGGPVLGSPRAARDFLIAQFAGLQHEVFAVLFLDSRHRVVAFEVMFRGTLDGSSVHPREVVKAALAHNAGALIISHNHPSGIAEPSQADEIITTRLRDALALVEVRLLDHLIIGGQTCTSLAEKGLI